MMAQNATALAGISFGQNSLKKKNPKKNEKTKNMGIPMKIAAGCASGANGKRLCHLKKKK